MRNKTNKEKSNNQEQSIVPSLHNKTNEEQSNVFIVIKKVQLIKGSLLHKLKFRITHTSGLTSFSANF